MLEVGLPDDPGPAVAAPAVVRRPEPLECQDADPAAGEVERGGAPDPARSEDDDVVGVRGSLPTRL